MACTSGGRKSVVSEQFPAGLRVLVVDDDVTCLRLLEQMLRKCMYKVTSCSHAMVALNLLRERKDSFDIILSDVHMPDMDGFKLLELVGLEMDLPVIMMSADGRTNIVMRGIQHGACDYLIKPVRDEELKNIWQHVVRKMWNGCKEHDHSGNITDNVCERRAIDDADNAFSASEMADSVLKTLKKRRDIKDNDDTELENDDPTMAKRPRVVWSLELHQQFVGAVNQLGIDKAVPKRILEMMNVPGLTREKVASHLQKFRLYLRRLSGIAQQGGLPSCYDWPIQQNPELSSSLGRFDVQTLAALHAALLPGPEGNLVLSSMNQSSHQHASLEGSKWIPVDRNVVYGKPLIKCSPNIVTRNSQPVVMSNEAAFGINNSMSMSLLQQQQQNQPTLQEPFRSINVVPSCLVLPYHPSFDFQQGNSSVSLDENHVFRNSPVDFKSQLLQPNSSPGVTVSSLSSCSKNAKDVAW